MTQLKNNDAEQKKLEQKFGIDKNNSNCNFQSDFNDPNYSDYLENYTNEKKLQQASKNVKDNVNVQNIKHLQNQVKQIPLPNFDSEDSNKFNGRQYINELNKEPIQFKNIENQKNQNKLPYLQNISQNIQKQFQNKTRSLSPKNSSRNQEFHKNKQKYQQNEQLKQLTSKFQDKISNDPKNSQYCEKQMKQIESLIYKGNAKMASFSIQNLVKTSLKNHGKKGYQFIQEMQILNKLNEILQNAQFGYFPDLIVLLWNNFGCAYRRIGQYQNAHDYFQKAINYMKKYKITSESGITYLNLSSLLSQMGKHEDAYEYGILAKQDCQADINSAINLNIDKEDIQSFREKVNYLAICNYNLGVESEFCKNIQNAISYYTSACEVYEKFQMQEFFAKMYFKFKDHLMKLKEKNLDNLQNVAQGKPMMNISGSNSYQELQFQKNKILQNNKNKYQNAVDKMGPAVVSQGIDYSETQNYIQLQNILKKHTKQNSNDKKKLFYLSDETQYATLQQEQYIIKDKQKQKKSRSPLRIKKYQQGMDRKQMDVQMKSDNEQKYNSYKNEIKIENQEQDIQDSVQYKQFYKKNQQDMIFELRKNPKNQQINSFYYNSGFQKARSQSPNMEYKRRPVGKSPRLNSTKNKMFDSMQQKIPYQEANQYEEENKLEKINRKEHILGGNSSFEIENQEESSMEIITKKNNFMFNKLNDTKQYKEETNQIKKYRTKKYGF
ncbi:hypothetical protein PPERSA_09796 [Pseudocohnilembus persalinus]|uniref:Uncharacterized protein n=1 Tax=Pseudocohnilembus persalinus TaxID=266149 RepID=A0A0V0QUM4_PSEPJ|nr:hypothetical protein PPERSA_09796 [Pseudocohnilembus persalinus]|eukprot:KRX05656.1 hypothetical protein PPERSA_09796 [Pseudocohnilembus persalinus]